MNRLQLELHRLFAVQASDAPTDAAQRPGVDVAAPVRALVLQVSKPADWGLLSPVWQGVQADGGLPAPAIAVAGPDGYQLWFSVATAVSATTGRAFLEALRLRYLPEVPTARVGLRLGIVPAADGVLPPETRHAAAVPALLSPGGPWSAFVSADLAPVFADEPWLDAPPADAGQAELLSRLSSMPLADFERVLGSLSAAAPAPALAPDPVDQGRPATAAAVPAGTGLDPRAFLLGVMNDPGVALALRIEAAKALLPFVDATQHR